MNKFLRDGMIYSIALLVLFGALDLFINSHVADASISGFPLEYSSRYTGLCPSDQYPCGNANFNSTNLAIDMAIPIIIGFGISYAKNSTVKK